MLLPSKITAGLTFECSVVLTAYPPHDWSLSALLRGAGTIDLVAMPTGTTHHFHYPADETRQWVPGTYWYSLRAANLLGEVSEVEAGSLTVIPDLALQMPGFDGSTHAQRVLAAIEAVLEKRATRDQEKYQINNRELWRTPLPDLLMLRDRYKREVALELKLKNASNLFGVGVRVRFRGVV